MYKINPKFITDTEGKKFSVVLPVKEFEQIMEELDELEDIRLYDEAMKDKSEPIPIAEAFKILDAKRKKA